jgi:hypothetical protein
VLRTYAHAIEDKTVTDAIFDTPVTPRQKIKGASSWNKRRKRA